MTKAELLADLESHADVVEVFYSKEILNGDENVQTPTGQTLNLIVEQIGDLTIYNIPFLKSDQVQTRADNFEGVTLDSGQPEERTIVKVTLQQVFTDRKAATATAFCDDGSTIKALLYKDGNDAWQTQILS